MKPDGLLEDVKNHLSPPVRGRGLKLASSMEVVSDLMVAPCAGAWVETRPTWRR